MNTENRTTSSESVVFKSRIFDVVERSYPGRSGAVQKRHIVKHPGAVGIIPILSDGRVLLISQFRISFQKVIYEIPAGTREAGEDPSKTAERELIEETGYTAGRRDSADSRGSRTSRPHRRNTHRCHGGKPRSDPRRPRPGSPALLLR